MTAPNTERRRRTPARVIALLVIVAIAMGLVALRISSGDTTVRVPWGARAGQMFLHPCTVATDDGRYAADCGKLIVPENRLNPTSRLIALPVTRVRAKTHHPGAPIFRLEGGPGISNMPFPQASRFAVNHDVVMVGYRGVDGSVRLDCPEVTAALTGASDLLAATT